MGFCRYGLTLMLTLDVRRDETSIKAPRVLAGVRFLSSKFGRGTAQSSAELRLPRIVSLIKGVRAGNLVVYLNDFFTYISQLTRN